MRFTWWIASLWPGCWHAWQLGQWRGLALAAVFAVAVNAALVTTFVWPQLFGTGLPPLASAAISWLLVVGLCSAGLVWLRRDWPRLTSREAREDLEVRFQQAQHEYLKGHWIEAETLLMQLLGDSPRDVEARLLLASIQRRTGRCHEACQTLRQLKEDESAGRWLFEVETDLKQIDELEGEANTNPDDKDNTDGELSRAA
jgi:hypothetical protein